MATYSKEFYLDQIEQSRISASHVIPVLLRHFTPTSVIDIGCGCGTWLSEFKKFGVRNVLGLDGEYVDRNLLLIDPAEFVPTDLEGDFSSRVVDKFDLAISLEVAEHIRPEKAQSFISSLVSLSDIILFSAALPFQGGTAHVNENWLEYWALLFRQHGFFPVDCIRPYTWTDDAICWWYRQNIIVFTTKEIAGSVFNSMDVTALLPLTRIHPEFFINVYWRNRTDGDTNIYLDSANFRRLCASYQNFESVQPPQDIINYTNTYDVYFDGIIFRIKQVLKMLRRYLP